MIDHFLLLLTLIVIFSISILIYKILNNKESFKNINDTIDIKEARLKLDLEDNQINYLKGTKGYKGEKGKKGITINGSPGRRGLKGDDGINGKNFGSLIFKNKEKEVIDQLLNIKSPKHSDFIIEVPDPIQGETGVVGTILFINHKKEIIGSYYPPDGSYAKTLKPIIINVPQGIIGENGDNGLDNTHPPGPDGEKGDNGEEGEEGERGPQGENGKKGDIGGGGEEDIFKNVKVSNKVCFKEEPTMCIDADLLKTLINSEDYLNELEDRKLRIIKKLCYLEFYKNYNIEKHNNRDELILEYTEQLKEIYNLEKKTSNLKNNQDKTNNPDKTNNLDETNDLDNTNNPDETNNHNETSNLNEINNQEETFNYNKFINEKSCPAFPEKPPCKYNGNHLDINNEYLFENCSCKKLTTDCGKGMFISREAYVGKDDKNNDIYISDNKCAECTLKREHINKDNGDVYLGCDGVYDGIAANCNKDSYIKKISGPKGYVCNDCSKCPESQYKADGCTGTEDSICKNCTNCSKNQFESKKCTHESNRECSDCKTKCNPGQYLTGTCGGNNTKDHVCESCPAGNYCNGIIVMQCPPGQISNTGQQNCTPCPCGEITSDNITCVNDKDNAYQYYEKNGGGPCGKISGDIDKNYWGWNAVASSILVPPRKIMSVYNGINFSGQCKELDNSWNDVPLIFDLSPGFDNNVQAIAFSPCPPPPPPPPPSPPPDGGVDIGMRSSVKGIFNSIF